MRSARKGYNTPLLAGGTAVVLAGMLGMVWLLTDDSGPTDPAIETVQQTSQEELPAPAIQEATPIAREPEAMAMPLMDNDPSDPVLPVATSGPTSAVEGKVVDPSGLPVEGAVVRLFKTNLLISGNFPGSRQRVDVQDISAADGTFRLDPTPVGKPYVVEAEHETWARSASQSFRIRKNRATDGIVVRMQNGATIVGMVVEADGGPPIPEARVELFYSLEMAFRAKKEQKPWKIVFTDAVGNFEFQHVNSNAIRLRVSARDFETQTLTRSYALEGRPKDEDLTFELNRGQALPGQVTDPDGNPVADARLEATSLTKNYQGSSVAFSDSGGNFSLEGLGTHYYQLRVTCEGYSDVTRPKIHITAGRIGVVMHPRGSVEGWVSTITGQPVSDFELVLMRSHASRLPTYLNNRHKVRNSADGYFTFADLEPGSYVLEARSEGWADSQSEPFTIDRATAGHAAQARIEMGKGGTLTGVVYAPDGKPAPSAQVKLNENNHVETSIGRLFGIISPGGERDLATKTNGEGRYTFTHITPRTYQVAVTHPDAAPRAVNDVLVIDDAQGGTPPLDVALPPGSVVGGRVIDNNSRPMPFTKVQLSQKGTGFMEATNTDKHGAFRFDNLKSGTFTLTLSPDRVDGEAVHPFIKLVYAQKSQREMFVGEGQHIEDVTLVLRKE